MSRFLVRSAARRACARCLLSVLLAVPALPLVAADTVPAVHKPSPQTLTFMFENDLFGDSDRQYTNGLKLSWLSGDLHRLESRPGVPPWLLRLVERLNAFERRVVDDETRQFNLGFAAGQMMYTPDDTQATALLRDDRPYAGWLYGAITFVSKSREVADTLELQGGMVGPSALAREAQDLVHDIRDLPRARGWDNQLENEPGFVLFYERKWRLARARLIDDLGYDFITHAGLALGNVYDYAATGGELRFGWKIPNDFGTSLIRPGGDANAPTVSSVQARGLGAYLFTALSGRLVARDIFLDGNTVADSHSVDKKPLVGDLIVGASLVYRGYKLSYAQVFRSKEFDGQRQRHNFGSITMTVAF